MKHFQVNLLIVLALSLCGLCAWQWYEQTVQRDEIQTLNRMVYEKDTAIQGYTNSVAALNRQVDQMDARLTEIKAAATTNEQLVISQRAEIAQLRFVNENATNEIAQYQAGVTALEAKLKDAYAGIEKQNEALTNLVAQRDDLVQKYNDEVKDRNDIVAKYNDLAKQFEKLQSGSGNSADK
jgi:chromosome segregation ATPase